MGVIIEIYNRVPDLTGIDFFRFVGEGGLEPWQRTMTSKILWVYVRFYMYICPIYTPFAYIILTLVPVALLGESFFPRVHSN